jgi:hypothetical protein
MRCIKDWLSNHPRRHNPNLLFVGLGRDNTSKPLTNGIIEQIYKDHKDEFFPRLLADRTVTYESQRKKTNSRLMLDRINTQYYMK